MTLNTGKVYNTDLSKQLKKLFESFLDEGGNLREKPIGKIGELLAEDEESIDFFRRFIKLLKYTMFFTEESKIYYSKVNMKYKDVAEVLGENRNLNTIQAKIYADRQRIINNFGNRFITDIIYRKDKRQLGELEDILTKVFNKYSNSNLLKKGLVLELPKDIGPVKTLGDEEFNDLIQVIAPYTKTQVRYIEGTLDPIAVAYCKTILSEEQVTGIDKQRKEVLETMLRVGV